MEIWKERNMKKHIEEQKNKLGEGLQVDLF